MYLRKLIRQDAPLMLEWMHDDSVVHDLKTDFASKSIEDCEKFIECSLHDNQNLHLAIVDESDNYQGTVSLKSITDGSAEFAITVRSCAMGNGYSKEAMEKIIDIGFDELNLSSIYWCVSPNNKRAVRFYDKNKYRRVSSDTLKNIRGGTAKNRFTSIFGISLQERKGGTESPDKSPDQTIKYGYSFPSTRCLKR